MNRKYESIQYIQNNMYSLNTIQIYMRAMREVAKQQSKRITRDPARPL